jgi:MFS transporter, ACS family, solute carrier family 17 (sodium-dependent inorganic phosphate cotransporter), other
LSPGLNKENQVEPGVSIIMFSGRLWPKRFTLVSMCFCASFICYIDRVNISVAAIAMQAEFGWNETVKGLVLSSFFVGYLAMQVAGGWLAHRIGGKMVLGFAVLWWSAFTILTPAAAFISLGTLFAVRVLLGLGEAATFPASFVLFSKWVPPLERSRAVAILLSGAPLGACIALFTTGQIIALYGWPTVFYFFGVFGFLWAVWWYRCITEEPATHPSITKDELELLQGQHNDHTGFKKVPWKLLLSKGPVWAIFINHFCTNWTVYMLISWLPSYFSKVQGLSTTSAGIHSAAPWLTTFVMMNVAGWIADTMLQHGLSVTFVRKLMQSVGLLGSAVFLILVQDASTAFMAMLLLCGALGLNAFTYAGFAPNALEIAPRYAGIVAGISNTIATIPGIIGVVITGFLVDLTGTYASAFTLAAGISVFGAVIWLLFASTELVVD